MTLKNRGWSRKTDGCRGPKSKGGSLAVGTYLLKDSAPPPGGGERRRDGGKGLGVGGWEGGVVMVMNGRLKSGAGIDPLRPGGVGRNVHPVRIYGKRGLIHHKGGGEGGFVGI